MKSKFIMMVICLLSFSLSALVQAGNKDMKALKKEAVSIVKKFGGTLKPQLKKALKSGGPVKAIDVCSKTAPEIAQKLSSETGWTVKRVSLKPRNSKTAGPDAWERKVLRQFDERQTKGELAKKMAYAEIVDGRFRFMKAQGVEQVCMNCHAGKVAPATEKALKHHYPDDKARGYSLGQIRGAFSLSKDL